MPWRYPDNIPKVAKNWTEGQQKRCISAGNSVLKRGGTDAEAIRACIAAAGKSSRQKQSSLSLAAPPRAPLALNPLPFAGAIASARRRGVVLPEVYYGELTGLARALAFTVSRLATVDQIDRVLKELTRNLEDGNTFADFKRAVEADPDVARLPRGRVETIYRNGVQTAYNRGRAEFHTRHKATRPYFLYSAINDSRVRPAHAAMDNVIAAAEHPIWHRWYPPNGHNSLLPDQRVSANAYLGLKAHYSGPIIEVIGQSGGRFTVTAQHPVLTRRGWVAAQDIQVGDELVAYGGDIGRRTVTADLDENHLPPTIEQVFKALGTGICATVPRAAMNLYGDLQFLDGDVEVVGVDRELVEDLKTRIDENIAKFLLHLAANRFTSRSAKCCADIIARRSIGNPAGLDRAFSLIGRSIFSGNGLEPIKLDSLISEVLGNLLSALAQGIGDIAQRQAALIHFNYLIGHGLSKILAGNPAPLFARQPHSLRVGPLGNTALADVFIGGLDVNPEALGDVLHAHAGSVKFDHVADIIRRDWSGHVYDLQTASGHILAFGGNNNDHYVLSNCRCSVISLTRAEAERRGVTVDLPDVKPDEGWAYSVMDDPDLGIKDAATKKRQSVNSALAALVPEGIPARLSLDQMIERGREGSERVLERVRAEMARRQQAEGRQIEFTPKQNYELFQESINAEMDINRRAHSKAAVIEGGGKAVKLVREASKRFPDTWTERADRMGQLRVKFSSGRGWHYTVNPDVRKRLVTEGPFFVEAKGGDGFIVAGDYSVALHEYAHRLQSALPELDDYFQELHVRRTAGETLESLRKLSGGAYDADEVTRKDNYIDEYMGKEYPSNSNMYTGRAGALEVMSMAFEDLMGGDRERFTKLMTKDHELYQLTLGLLLHYDP